MNAILHVLIDLRRLKIQNIYWQSSQNQKYYELFRENQELALRMRFFENYISNQKYFLRLIVKRETHSYIYYQYENYRHLQQIKLLFLLFNYKEPPMQLDRPKNDINFVIKRNGEPQAIDTIKIQKRLQNLSFGLNMKFVNLQLVINKVIHGMYNGIKTTALDELAAETCAYMNLIHPHYSLLAARIAVDNLHKQTPETLKQVADKLYSCKNKRGQDAPLLSDDVYRIIVENSEQIEKMIDYRRDFTYDYFGFKTLQRAYLLKVDGAIVERPQHMLMRVSIGIHKQDLTAAFQTYELMSNKWFTHATPTLFNAGLPTPQMSSCFLLQMKEDSIGGIYDTLTQCAKISKYAGGVGLSVSNIRAKQSYIRGTNGASNGIIPMLRVFNDTARYVDQGGGKRKGSFAIYLQPWHADIFEFLQLRKNTGKEENRARDLFLGLWVPDLFMERVNNDSTWTLMCPNECIGLPQKWGKDFEQLYIKYENQGKGRKTIKAREVWQAIVDSQIQTGLPYMLYKDHCNSKSNQQNLGTIKCSNLCTQIVEYTSPEEVAVCNLASISLPRYIIEGENGIINYDFNKLMEVTRIITRNLNKIIDLNYYPIPQTKTSNLKHRPIGIGIQGMADTFQRMKLSFESEEANVLNQKIFETIYYAAASQSHELARIHGPYSTFEGSPASKGKLQFDLWNYTPNKMGFDWETLKENIIKNGMRNSLLIAPMPTASTSQILGNNQSFEAYTSNVYTRRVLAGQFVCVNTNLVNELIQANLWTPEIKNKLLATNGSVQDIPSIPKNIKDLYKTVWEISQKKIIDLARSRAPFIDQSQSLNIHLGDANYSKITSMHFYSWNLGLKTGMYYLRSRPAADPIQFTVDVQCLLKTAGQIQVLKNEKQQTLQGSSSKSGSNNEKQVQGKESPVKVCPMRRKGAPIDEQCLACGS